MVAEPLVLGLDVGTSHIKAVLVDRAGAAHGSSRVPTPFARNSEGTEMSVDQLHDGLREVLEALGPERERVVGVGIAGVAESGAPLDDEGRAVGPIIAWHDPRGSETVERLDAEFGDEIPRLIGQRLRPVSSVAKLGWLCEQGLRDVRRWLGVPELCVLHLTGAETTEHSLAVRTGCYDVARQRYLPEVARSAGFSVEVFASVEPAGAPMGRVSSAGSAWSGLPRDSVVTLAGHDHLAGADGCGARDDDFVNSVGTAETVIGRRADLPDIDRAVALRAAVTIPPGGHGWAVLTSAARAGLIVDRVARELGHSPPELDAMASSEGRVDAEKLVERLQQGEEPVLPPGPPGAVWNGMLESLAGRTRDAVERTWQLTGPPARLLVFGGGSGSRPWLAAKARAVSVPLLRAGVAEAVSRGAAIRAGMAAGWWQSPDDAPPAPLEPVSPAPR